ncbi:hypothetical protein [Glycomyces paridis]|uniref:Uncharacterized protein n=1 Tax=Glycomyces paridis TaxID=2126555 RepID=A0A4S8PHN0_9ACTN|nr:hypothetical protein [Glycomyces paridis]THV30103.1 hypothetical protein E9998_06915 [Glycomyces paridis]
MRGLDRKAIPKNLEVSYRRGKSHYTDLRGRPVRSKPLLHRDPSVELVPSRYATSLSDPMVTESGTGRLELVLDAAATMPVASVDGELVAVGEGTVYVVLPAGLWTVEVQGGETVSPVVVDIADQVKTRLVWFEGVDRRVHSFGASAAELVSPVSKVYLYEWLFMVFLICGLPTAVVQAFLLENTDSRVILGVIAAIGLFLLVLLPWKRRERARVNAGFDEQRRAGRSRVRRYPLDGVAAADRPALLGDDPEDLPAFANGHGAVLLRLKGHRHLWKDGEGVCVRDVERASLRASPPTVRIDGFEQQSTWGNWWYPMRPGKHVVEVECDLALSGAPQRISERLDIEVREGEATVVRADAHLFVDRGPGESGPVQAREGTLRLRPEAFEAAWMADPAKRVAFWTDRL